MQLKWYRVLKKMRLNRPALGLLRSFCKSGDLPMSEAEARAVLEEVYPFHVSTCVREIPRNAGKDGVMLSIIVPTYNNAAYIEECLNSALSQQVNFSLEILVVNDGSTDDTAEKLKRFSDPQIRIFSQRNAGVSAARNAAMDAAKGKYFLFLDGDDILLPGALEKLVSCAERENAAIVEGGYRMMDMDGKPIHDYEHPAGPMDAARELSGFVCFKVFRREVWERLQFPGKIYYEDSVMAQVIREQIAEKGEKVFGISEAVGGYRYNLGSFSNTFQARPISIDTVWITENLLRDRQEMGLTATESYHDHLLEMAKLSWIRLEAMPVRVQQAMFVLYRKWILENDVSGEKVPDKLKNLDFAFEKGSFKLFRLCGCLED